MTANGPQILVNNSGSSSLKFSVLRVQSESVLVSGIAERLGTTEALLKLSDTDARVLNYWKVLWPEINEQWNRVHGEGNKGRITEETGLACFFVPTNEELAIARQTAALVLRKPNRTLSEHDAGQTL
jgi:acetate kinase